MLIRSILLFIFSLFFFEGKSQVDHSFEIDHGLFLSSYFKHKKQWVCGMEISAVDSTNIQLTVRFDLLKDWVEQDSLICTLTLDTTQTYITKFKNFEKQTLRYHSPYSMVTVFLCVPTKYEYTLSNGMTIASYQFHNAKVILPKRERWKKHQKRFSCFYEK